MKAAGKGKTDFERAGPAPVNLNKRLYSRLDEEHEANYLGN